MKNTFGNNVAMLRTNRGISQRDLADALGISKGTVGAWEAQGSTPNMPTMERLANYFGVTVGQLFTEGMRDPRNDGAYTSKQLGVFGHIAAGKPIDMERADFAFPCPTRLLAKHPRAFYLKVDGDSMNCVLPDGCYALVDPDMCEPIVNGRAYAVCVNGNAATIKRVRSLANGVELIPDSYDPTYRSQVFDRGVEGVETITIIGRVVWYTVPLDYEI